MRRTCEEGCKLDQESKTGLEDETVGVARSGRVWILSSEGAYVGVARGSGPEWAWPRVGVALFMGLVRIPCAAISSHRVSSTPLSVGSISFQDPRPA